MKETQNVSASSTRNIIPLEALHVASPCKADWNAMSGDAKARFCGSCEKHVYNLSAMTRDEAQALVTAKEGNLCVRFYERADGTMLTSDCRVGAAALSMRLHESALKSRYSPLRILALLVVGFGAMLPNSVRANASGIVDSMRRAPLVGNVIRFVSPQVTAGAPLMGKPVAPPQPKNSNVAMMTMGEMVAIPTPKKSHVAPAKTVKSAKKRHTTSHRVLEKKNPRS